MQQNTELLLPDHEFPLGERHTLISSFYDTVLKKDGQIDFNRPTFISIRSAGEIS